MTLKQAAENGGVAALRALLARGAVVEPSAAGEDSPLCIAAMYGHLEAARVLLEAGADVNHRGGYGRTPLHYAASRTVALTSLVLDHGADLGAVNDGDFDALEEHTSSDRAEPGIVALLLARGFELSTPKTKYRVGSSQLGWACSCGRLDVVDALLAAGADPNEGDALGEALSATKREHLPALLAALVKGGIDANFVSRSRGVSVLMAVCEAGDVHSAQLLLERGANPNARHLGSPLTKAEASGNQVLVDLLLEHGAVPFRPPIPGALAAARDEAEARARAQPEDPNARLAWARVLVQLGHRAAAASEAAAAVKRGGVVPEELQRALELENPAGTKWTFAEFAAPLEGVARAVDDARFPGARVSSGERTLPLVIVLGPYCAQCDEKGETVCTDCDGSGTRSGFFNSDHDYPCSPRQACTNCGGLKYEVNTMRFGKGPCKHKGKKVLEAEVLGSKLSRCRKCGLAALTTGGYWSDMNACGVCGLFSCRCDRK